MTMFTSWEAGRSPAPAPTADNSATFSDRSARSVASSGSIRHPLRSGREPSRPPVRPSSYGSPGRARCLRPANARRGSVPLTVPALPRLCGHVRRHRSEEEKNGVHRFVPGGAGRPDRVAVRLEVVVREFHTGGDRRVEAPPVEVVRYLSDQSVRPTPQLQIGIAVGFLRQSLPPRPRL